MAVVEIYALHHPYTLEIRYIGKANDAKKRLASHLRDARRRDTPVYRWIRKLVAQGKTPIVSILEVCDDKTWKSVEIRLISQHDSKRLLNVAIGGDEPFCSKEQRAINGRNTARSIHDNPMQKKIWKLKQMFGIELSRLKKIGDFDTYNHIVRRLKGEPGSNMHQLGWFSHLTEIS